MIAIDKRVPIPDQNRRTRKYPFNDMEVDDSFFVGCHFTDVRKIANSVSSAAIVYAKKNKGTKFTVRRFKEGVRCWRVK